MKAAAGGTSALPAPVPQVQVSGAEGGNLMPLFIECVENDITLGEICNTLRGVWGEYVAEGF